MLTNLTQSHLSLLETCPRKFRQVYLDGLTAPPPSDLQASQLWGNRFHLLMQQRELGLPLPPTAAETTPLTDSVQALVSAAPELFAAAPSPQLRQSEHRRSLAFEGYSLTVIYDLLLLSATAGQIVDWKTYFQLRSRAALERDWQSRLYRYVLVETSPLAPEQVTMSYWFVRHRDPQTQTLLPQEVRLSYSQQQHQQTHQDLQRLTEALSRYSASGHFPQVDPVLGRCDRCPFAVPCDRAGQQPVPLPAFDEIAEVPL